jgi:hypothetical protein
MSKYNRHQSVIYRQADEYIDEEHWLKQFQKSLQKNAVQPRSVDVSLFEQINSIMNNKSKYPSVEAAVEDMKERSGLTAYLNKINKTSNTISIDELMKKKTASDNNDSFDKKIPLEKTEKVSLPKIIQEYPKIEHTIKRYIESSGGNLAISAVIAHIRYIHDRDVGDSKHWEEQDLKQYVSDLSLQEQLKKLHNNSDDGKLGTIDYSNSDDIDPDNNDAFSALNPAK